MRSILLALPIALGFTAAFYLLFMAWYRRLIYLPSNSDIAKRRKRAAIEYPFVGLLAGVLFIAEIACLPRIDHPYHWAPILIQALTLIPGIIYWVSKIPVMKGHGFGSPRR